MKRWRELLALIVVAIVAAALESVTAVGLALLWERLGWWLIAIAIVLLCLLLVFLWARWQVKEAAKIPPPVPQTAAEFLQRYGLDQWLTAEDDPELWAAAVRQTFPMPEDDWMMTSGLQFAVGKRTPHTRFKIQPTAATHFKRRTPFYLTLKPYREDDFTDADVDQALTPTVPLLLLHLDHWKETRKRPPLWSLVLPRPTVGLDRVPIYQGSVDGRSKHVYIRTNYWKKTPEGKWVSTTERLT